MSRRKAKPDPEWLDRVLAPMRRLGVGRKVGAFVVISAIGLVSCSGSGDPPPAQDAANEQPVEAVDPDPVEVATGFVKAYAALDLDQAASYLAEDADVTELPNGTLENPENAWFQAMGYEQIFGTCEEEGSSDLGTSVRCPYEFHLLRSEEIGNGPYSGSSFELTVKDGAVVRAAEYFEFESNGFSAEMWEPFAKWVKKTHPSDVLLMYVDGSQTMGRLDEESLRLWERRSLEFASEMAAG